MKKLQIIFLCVFFGFLSPMTHLVNALTEFHLYTKLNQSEPFKDTSDGNRDPSDAFIITVKTDNAGGSADNQFIVPTRFGGYDYTIDTSDGQTINDLTGDYTITFPTPGTYDILISGDFPWYRGRYSADKDKLIEVKNWGIIAWENFDGAFAGCNNLTVISATDVPDLSNVTNLSSMFYGNNILEINNIEKKFIEMQIEFSEISKNLDTILMDIPEKYYKRDYYDSYEDELLRKIICGGNISIYNIQQKKQRKQNY